MQRSKTEHNTYYTLSIKPSDSYFKGESYRDPQLYCQYSEKILCCPDLLKGPFWLAEIELRLDCFDCRSAAELDRSGYTCCKYNRSSSEILLL